MKAHIRKLQQKTVLVYGLSAVQQQKLTELFCAENVICRAVTPSQTAATVTRLFENEAFSIQAHTPPPAGKFAVLDGFDAAGATAAAARINSVCPGVIKAVRTPHNSGWRFCALCEELAAEHKAMTEGDA